MWTFYDFFHGMDKFNIESDGRFILNCFSQKLFITLVSNFALCFFVMTLRTYHKIVLIEMQKRSLFKVTIFNMGLDREFAYWSHKYVNISETVHLRHFVTPDEYHHHCIAFNLGYFFVPWSMTLKDYDICTNSIFNTTIFIWNYLR